MVYVSQNCFSLVGFAHEAQAEVLRLFKKMYHEESVVEGKEVSSLLSSKKGCDAYKYISYKAVCIIRRCFMEEVLFELELKDE